MKKHILTDVDGVLLRWEDGFDNFMSENGHNRLPGTETLYNMTDRYGLPSKDIVSYINYYNQSDKIANLLPFADSVEYVTKLANQGFRFTAITSLSDHPNSKKYRTQNLLNLFGDVFDDVICLAMNSSKAHVLMEWADTGYFWVEDHMRQAEAGYEAGLKTVLINHPYNTHYKTDLFPTVSYETPWKEIYEMVIKTYNL